MQLSERPDALPDARWRASVLTHAPHRLSFFLAIVMLIASGVWWLLVQMDRTLASAVLSYTVAPTLVHSVVMCFGFLPLFFAGFLFTAGPKWLQVEPPSVRVLLPPLLLQATGWLLWLGGSMYYETLAGMGGAAAWLGLTWVCVLFWRLVLRSRASDKIHAYAIAAACTLGCLCLAGAELTMLAVRFDVTRAFVLSALWGFVGVVYVVVAHRMIPFFTSSALPMLAAWRPFWVLHLLLAAMMLKVLEVWVALLTLPGWLDAVWTLLCGLLQLMVGLALLWLTYRWGLVQSLKNRLLAMLHIGFAWIGVAFIVAGGVKCLELITAAAAGWELAALHAFTMGALGSLLLAMVTRVSCGHSGRMLHADHLVYGLFCLLQLTVVLRMAAALGGSVGAWLLSIAALLWTVVIAVWGGRLCTWYGKPRVDGRPG